MPEAALLDGRRWAAAIKERVRDGVGRLAAAGQPCCLAVLLAGDNAASAVYVRGKQRDCAECGITSQLLRFPETVTTRQLVDEVRRLNADPAVSGILVQLPLPAGVEAAAVVEAIAPEKDVDGFTAVNTGRLWQGAPGFRPCTPAGCLYLLQQNGVPLAGRRAVVLGRSAIVGKPMAALLTACDATVTLCHSHTPHLADVCRQADILVAAVGRPGFVTPDMVRPGAAVVDVGINRLPDGKLCGDVAPEVCAVAGWLSPVPGGVGLMTRAMLMANTLRAAAQLAGCSAAAPALDPSGRDLY